jgi:hypothetical protein
VTILIMQLPLVMIVYVSERRVSKIRWKRIY